MLNLQILEDNLNFALNNETEQSLKEWFKTIQTPNPPVLPPNISHVVYPFEGYEDLDLGQRFEEIGKSMIEHKEKLKDEINIKK